MNDVTRITASPVAAPAGAGDHTIGAAPASGGTSFQALLDRLQRLANEQPKAPDAAAPDQLHDALRAAEQSYTTAMDLRRQLEEAFRRHAP